jgi:hypothetical protein
LSPNVQPLRVEPFPLAACRDLIGLVRAMWLAAEPGSERRRALTSIGLDLRLALGSARSMPFPNTPQQASAWFVAERAIRNLAELLADDPGELRPVIEAMVVKAGFGPK